MKKLKPDLIAKTPQLYKILLFLIAIVSIVLIFPEEGKFKYEFQKGKPWMHDDLIAPFDFPVRKTEAELKIEKNRLVNGFRPYYFYDYAKTEQSRSELIKQFDEELT